MKRLLLLFLLISFGNQLIAQNSASIIGKITDASGYLPGVNVTIKNTKKHETTNIDGSFKIDGVATGKSSIVISYLGYANKEIAIDLVAGINNLGVITLTETNNTLNEVIVKGATAASQIKALSIKKNAKGIMEVLAADAIGKFPDRNAAEAIQRIQGVSIARDAGEGRYYTVRGVPTQWTASLLNGNRLSSASVDYQDRRVQMDIFPSELIQYVQMSKAITPDIEGDNIGGSVNFVTRTSVPKRTLAINAAGGYNGLSQKDAYNASIVYGDRFLNNKLSFIASAVIWNRPARVNRYNINYNFTLPSTQSFSMSELQLRDYDMNRKTTGQNIGLEYTFNSKNKIFLKGINNQYNDDQMVREEYFNYNGSYLQMQTRHTINVTKLASVELGGENALSSKLKFDWTASYDQSSAKSTNPSTNEVGYPIVNFKQPMTFNGLSSDGKMYLKMDSPNGVGDVIDHVLPHNAVAVSADNLKLNQVLNIRIKNDENNRRFGGNFTYEISDNFKMKFGTKYQSKNKSVDNAPMDVYLAGILGTAPTLSSFSREQYPLGGGFLKNLDSPYNNVIINHINSNQIYNLVTPDGIAQNKLFKAVSDSPTNASGAVKYYNGTESVFANYIMGEYKVNPNLNLIGGFRNESNNGTFNGMIVTKVNSTTTTITPISQSTNYNAFLPMLHVKYTPTDKDIVRLAYTKGFIRPDFGSLNPATTQNDLSMTITQGNPNLKPTFSNNFDLMYEHYFGGIGLVNAGAFYKDISNFIYNKGGSQAIGAVNYLITQPENLDKAKIYGFEGGIQKRFLELPGFWNGFGVEANYTYIKSQAKIPRLISAANVSPSVYAIDVITLPQQSKDVFNLVLLYEKNNFSTRLAGNYKGKSVFTINAAYGTDHYVYAASNFTMDFSSSYTINKKVRIFLEVNNITDTATRYFMGTSNRVYQGEWYGIRGQLGINVKLF